MRAIWFWVLLCHGNRTSTSQSRLDSSPPHPHTHTHLKFAESHRLLAPSNYITSTLKARLSIRHCKMTQDRHKVQYPQPKAAGLKLHPEANCATDSYTSLTSSLTISQYFTSIISMILTIYANTPTKPAPDVL